MCLNKFELRIKRELVIIFGRIHVLFVYHGQKNYFPEKRREGQSQCMPSVVSIKIDQTGYWKKRYERK